MIFSNKTSLVIVKYISKISAAGITYIILVYTDVFFHKKILRCGNQGFL